MVALAAAGFLVFFVAPLAGLVQRAPWHEFGSDLTDPATRDALRLSLECSLAATALSVLVGVPIAWVLARTEFRGRSIVRALALLPMVLPPVVGGVALLVAFGRTGLVGQYLDRWFGITLAFSTWGVILAETFVAMPFLVITVDGALRSLDTRYEDAGATLGASRWTVMRRVTLPAIAPSLAAGAALTWARALGEFGATITFAGNLPRDPDDAARGLSRTPRRLGIGDRAQSRAARGVDHGVGGRGPPGVRQPGCTGIRVTNHAALDASVELQLGTLSMHVELRAGDRELVVLVGPNGAGKSTLLRVLAGLTPIDAGAISLDGIMLDDPSAGVFVPPERRPVAMMFQDALLFRHLDALDNVAFGMRAGGNAQGCGPTSAAELLTRLGLAQEMHAKPHELSGGQAQRVALARALAVEPRALLLDEPLSALDAQTRVEVRRTLREQLTTFPGVRVLVSHDPLEALTLADRIVVLEAGRVVQTGTPDEVRRHPRSPYVAALLGVNLLMGRLTGDGRFVVEAGGELHVAANDTGAATAIIDPNAVSLFGAEPHGSARNCWRAVVSDLDRATDRVRVHFASPFAVTADVTPAAAAELALEPGAEVWCAVKATAIQVEPR